MAVLLPMCTMAKWPIIFACAAVGVSLAQAQDSTAKLEIHGYVKYMQINMVGQNQQQWVLATDNLIHNRLNLVWYLAKSTALKVEVRNRAFYGELTKASSGSGAGLGQDPGFFDLSHAWIDHSSLVVHSMVDRFNLTHQADNYTLRLGRQRINWGISTLFTPNDVFNAFNYFDFDYEERPGVDALRWEWQTGDMSGLDVAVAPGSSGQDWVFGIKYGHNYKGFDLQYIVANYKRDAMVGMGMAGQIGGSGIKAELSIFQPRRQLLQSPLEATGTLAIDRTFGTGWYVSVGGLYVGQGSTAPLGFGGSTSLMSAHISVKRLMPTKYTLAVMTSKSLGMKSSLSVVAMYAPGSNMIILFPSLAYSIANNWDIDLVVQSMFMEGASSNIGHGGTGFFARMRWSY
jgi:hypothetical protein